MKLISKFCGLGLGTSLFCNWILNFLTHRPQSVRIGTNTSSTIILNTSAPQGCVLSPRLYSLYTYDCAAKFPSNSIFKFDDDTTVVGRISNNDEIENLVNWFGNNNLSLNINKTKEIVIDFRKRKAEHAAVHITKNL